MVLQALRPRYWFAGHLHAPFAAVVPHAQGGGAAAPSARDAQATTRFLAVDKPLPRRQYVSVHSCSFRCMGVVHQRVAHGCVIGSFCGCL